MTEPARDELLSLIGRYGSLRETLGGLNPLDPDTAAWQSTLDLLGEVWGQIEARLEAAIADSAGSR